MNTSLIEGLSNLQPTDLDAGQVFSGKPSGTTVKGYATSSAYTPSVDHDYLFHESSRDVVVWFLNPQEPLYIFGPTGCGKTTCIKQLAASCLMHVVLPQPVGPKTYSGSCALRNQTTTSRLDSWKI